jgi:hypothetical protein
LFEENNYHKDFIYLPKDGSRIGWHSELVSYCDYIKIKNYLDANLYLDTKLNMIEDNYYYKRYRNKTNDEGSKDILLTMNYEESTTIDYPPSLGLYFNELKCDINISWNPVYADIEAQTVKKLRKIQYCIHPLDGHYDNLKFSPLESMDKIDPRMKKDLLNSSNSQIVSSLLKAILNYKEEDGIDFVPSLT